VLTSELEQKILDTTLKTRQTHDYKRHGTTALFAAFNILNGKVMGRCLPAIAVGSSSRSCTNWKRKCRRIWITALTKALPSSVGSGPGSAADSTFI
jgi:hypothetical protein